MRSTGMNPVGLTIGMHLRFSLSIMARRGQAPIVAYRFIIFGSFTQHVPLNHVRKSESLLPP